MKTLDDLKQKLSKSPRFKQSYYRHDPAYRISLMFIEERIKKGWTQKQLAKKIGSTQSAIARAEGGKHLMSLKFLQKIAKVYKKYLHVSLTK